MVVDAVKHEITSIEALTETIGMTLLARLKELGATESTLSSLKLELTPFKPDRKPGSLEVPPTRLQLQARVGLPSEVFVSLAQTLEKNVDRGYFHYSDSTFSINAANPEALIKYINAALDPQAKVNLATDPETTSSLSLSHQVSNPYSRGQSRTFAGNDHLLALGAWVESHGVAAGLTP